ncbi:hypothetical protein GGR44_000691 [Sphingobium fontiphilum]|uniref:Uncharacterized protein n=1 Tax=Sphingobium fontiphilum TaxID=944425 RepID=A0A7W6DI74_9SPHN|nr:hypothetical protein [Sphingobium fontiphilum]
MLASTIIQKNGRGSACPIVANSGGVRLEKGFGATAKASIDWLKGYARPA